MLTRCISQKDTEWELKKGGEVSFLRSNVPTVVSSAQVWSWINNDYADTCEIVFLDEEQVAAVTDYINTTAQEPVTHLDFVLHKSWIDSKDSSFIQFIDLDDDNKIKNE